MTSTKSFLCTVIVVALCAFGTGCASFKGNNLPEVGSFPGPASDAERPSVALAFSSETDMMARRPHPERVREQLEAEFVGVLRDSGYFSAIEKAEEGKDLGMKLHLVNSGNPAAFIPAFITGLSLYTIPSWGTDRFTVVCNVRLLDGKQYEYTLEDSAMLVQWLPMIFALPFNLPTEVPVEVRKNIYKNLIIKMQEDGIIPPDRDAPKTSNLFITFEILHA